MLEGMISVSLSSIWGDQILKYLLKNNCSDVVTVGFGLSCIKSES